ncbi:unnamed protein product [Effrenium voratum]|nr:unnamed protein product [Effrenium voratum]
MGRYLARALKIQRLVRVQAGRRALAAVNHGAGGQPAACYYWQDGKRRWEWGGWLWIWASVRCQCYGLKVEEGWWLTRLDGSLAEGAARRRLPGQSGRRRSEGPALIGIPKPPEARPEAPEARPEAPEVRPEAPEVRPEVPPIALPKPQHARPVPQLPTPAEQWRAPELELEKRCAPPAPPMPPTPTPPSSSQRSHDALPRRLKPHTWDIAALGGDEPKSPQERSDRPKTQQPIGMHKPPMALAVEAEVVDHLLSRFVLERKAAAETRAQSLQGDAGAGGLDGAGAQSGSGSCGAAQQTLAGAGHCQRGFARLSPLPAPNSV